MLINIGESYIVANLIENSIDQVVQLKLRVFSVNRPDTPDLYSCQHKEQMLVIGRSPNCDIRIEDELLSKMQS
jgi:hypothetical protein